MFRDLSWFSVLLGMNFPFDVPRLQPEQMEAVRLMVDRNRRRADELLNALPNNYEYLRDEVYAG
jgi:hypothetical protein